MKNYTNTTIIYHKLLRDPTDSILYFSLQFVSSTVFTQMKKKGFLSKYFTLLNNLI